MKKISTILLSVAILVICTLAVSTSVAAETDELGIEYTLENGGYTVTGYTGTASELIIPEKFNGKTVKAIGANAFENCDGLTSVVIPDSVTTIGSEAFSDCNALSDITLSKKLREIGYYAFYNCDSLSAITIPASLQAVGTYGLRDYGIFDECDGLTTATFEEGFKSIPAYIFADCASLEAITIPNGVTDIANDAFRSCISLKSVTIPNTVTSIGKNAFENCDALESVVIPDSVTTIGSEAFSDCNALSDITLSKKLREIGYYAFYNCDSLSAITIPASLQTVGTYGLRDYGIFDECDGLTNVFFEEGTETIPAYLFANCPGLQTITIPKTVAFAGQNIFNDCANLSTVYCEVQAKPSHWDNNWKGNNNATVIWGKAPLPVVYIIDPSLNMTIDGDKVFVPDTTVTADPLNVDRYTGTELDPYARKFGFVIDATVAGGVSTPNGKYKVTIILPGDYSKDITVLYFDQDKKATEIKGRFDETGAFVFETDKLGDFFVADNESKPKYIKGNINGNETIDSMDYVLLKRAYFGTYKLSDIGVGDINNNGIIDSMDYVYLRRAYFGTYVIK